MHAPDKGIRVYRFPVTDSISALLIENNVLIEMTATRAASKHPLVSLAHHGSKECQAYFIK